MEQYLGFLGGKPLAGIEKDALVTTLTA